MAKPKQAKDLVQTARQRVGLCLNPEKEVLRLEREATLLHAAILQLKIDQPEDYFDRLEAYKAGIDYNLKGIRKLNYYE